MSMGHHFLQSWRERESYFVDATLGIDANSGRSPSSAWQTISKVNGETFSPGDYILFNRGETWVGEAQSLRLTWSGAPGSPITFGAYGTGAMPILYKAYSPSAQSYIQLEHLDFNCAGGEIYSGQLNLSHSIVDDCIFRNATGEGLIFQTSSYDTMRNCQLYDNDKSGMFVEATSSYITIEDCVAHDNGTHTAAHHGIYFKGDHQIVRRCTCYNNAAGGIKLNEASDSEVSRNYCYGNYQGLVLAGADDGDPATERNLVANNICYGNTVNGIHVIYHFDDSWIYHNTLVNNGVPDLGSQIYFEIAGADGNIVENNTLHQDSPGMIDGLLRIVDTATRNANTFDHNLYYVQGERADIIQVNDVGWYTWAEWQALGEDPNGVNDDPLFVTEYTDLHIQATSPCRGAGVDVGVLVDYDGVERGDPPDIGALQYVA